MVKEYQFNWINFDLIKCLTQKAFENIFWNIFTIHQTMLDSFFICCKRISICQANCRKHINNCNDWLLYQWNTKWRGKEIELRKWSFVFLSSTEQRKKFSPSWRSLDLPGWKFCCPGSEEEAPCCWSD